MTQTTALSALFQVAWKFEDRLIRAACAICAVAENALARTRRALKRRWWRAVLSRPERFGPLVDEAADELDRLDHETEGTPTPRRIAR